MVAGWSFRLADGRKSFGKTGTSEDLAVSGGSFIPNQIAAFAVVGDAQNPYTNRISNIAINGRYNSYWDGSTIAAPAVTNFFNSYISKKKIPIDNDYGQPVSKYNHDWQVSGHWRTNVQRAADHYEWQQPIAEQQQSVSVAEHWAKQHPNPGHQFRAVE